MRTMPIRWLFLTILAALCAPVPGAAKGGFSVTVRSDEIRDCSDIEVVPTRDEEVATAEEALTLPQPRAAERLTVEGSRNGGVWVVGGTGRDYEVRVCKAAAASTRGAAQRMLERIRVDAESGRLTVRGPADDDWIAYLLVTAPRGAAMAVTVHNGPLAVREATGDFQLRAENGPIALRGTAGTFDVAVRNGPVAIEEAGGDVTVRASNGPISVRLGNGAWEGEGLDARAVNGPLSLWVDEDFRSGLVVETSQHSPWTCAGCGAGRRTWDDDGDRRFELGDGPVRVRLSTVNGPVSIKVR